MGAAISGGGLSGLGAVSAGVGQASSLGALSVPSSWAAAVPAALTSQVAAALPGTSLPAVTVSATGGMSGMTPPLAGLIGGHGTGGTGPRYGFRPTVVVHPPAAG